jgi:hypothetical protein
VGVGLSMVVAPRLVLRSGTRDISGSMLLLTRTIGIRDVVIGAGTLLALVTGTPADARRWVMAGTASDALDVVAGAKSAPWVGRRSAVLAAAIAAQMAAADVWVLLGTDDVSAA